MGEPQLLWGSPTGWCEANTGNCAVAVQAYCIAVFIIIRCRLTSSDNDKSEIDRVVQYPSIWDLPTNPQRALFVRQSTWSEQLVSPILAEPRTGGNRACETKTK